MDYQETIEIIEYASAFNSENSRLTKALSVAITAMQELQQYEKIGTLEEVREAVEKHRKVKPEDGEYCPICHTFLKDDDDVPGFYCMNCGQAIDWSEVDEKLPSD